MKHAFAKAVSTNWLIVTPVIGLGFVLSLLLREYSLERKTVRGAQTESQMTKDQSADDIQGTVAEKDEIDEPIAVLEKDEESGITA